MDDVLHDKESILNSLFAYHITNHQLLELTGGLVIQEQMVVTPPLTCYQVRVTPRGTKNTVSLSL